MQSPRQAQSIEADNNISWCLDVNAATSPSVAVSLNKQKQRRIYTSTPKSEYKNNRRQTSQQQQRNDAIGFCKLAKHYICVGGGGAAAVGKGQGPTFDVRLKLLVIFAVVIIGYRIVSLIMAYINGDNVQQLTSYVQAQLSTALDWSEEHQLRSWLSPLLCGVLMAAFSYAMVYLDSDLPGLNPPAPFLPRSKQRCGEKSLGLNVNYMCALGAGVVVTLLMYADF